MPRSPIPISLIVGGSLTMTLLFITSVLPFSHQQISSSVQSYFQHVGLLKNQSQSESISATISSTAPDEDQSKCNLYSGRWAYDPRGPLYTNSCAVIPEIQNCRGNGRPDTGYENWRWKPDDCELPRFDAKKFLRLMRNKTLAFVGDSVARNQMQSLLCILLQEESQVRNRGYHTGSLKLKRWFFRPTSTVIARIWSSWLVDTTVEPLGPAPEGILKIHLDVPDKGLMEFLPRFDVVVLSSGHWFAKQSAYVLNNTVVGGQNWWPEEAGKMEVNDTDAFGISVETALNAIASHPKFTGLVILRSYSPSHYNGGEWNTGGSCTGKTEPASEVVRDGYTAAMHAKQVEGFQRAVKKLRDGGSKLRMMDITEMFDYRRDGHPGPYRNKDPNKAVKRGPDGKQPPQDCLHWCMPGAVDTWNEILFEIIKREFNG